MAATPTHIHTDTAIKSTAQKILELRDSDLILLYHDLAMVEISRTGSLKLKSAIVNVIKLVLKSRDIDLDFILDDGKIYLWDNRKMRRVIIEY